MGLVDAGSFWVCRGKKEEGEEKSGNNRVFPSQGNVLRSSTDGSEKESAVRHRWTAVLGGVRSACGDLLAEGEGKTV